MRHTRLPFLALGVTLALGADPGWGAGNVEAGAAKAKPCRTCHGRDGIGTMPHFPNLAGQKGLYMTQQLQAYRSGARVSEIMGIIAKPLSDEDIADLTAYYESLPPGGKAP